MKQSKRSVKLLYVLPAMFFFATLLSSAATAQSAPATPHQVERAIHEVIEDDIFENAFWGVMVTNLKTGQPLFEHNAGKSFIPASNTKLFTTAAALEHLGADYRYRTALYADGPVVDGELHGNLIVRGSGDPVIGGRFNNGDRTEVFRAWADSLRAAGIDRITGDIIGDDDVFDDTPLGRGWSWDDEAYWYSAEISGLSFNDNAVDFTMRSRQTGMPAQVSWEPFNTNYVQVINSTVTISPDSSLKEGYTRASGSNTIRLSSRIPRGTSDLESLTVSNPTLYFVHVLRESLLRSGIAVSGEPVDVDDMPIKPDYARGRFRRIATHLSPPLADIISVINKRSQNLYAEQLLKTLAAEFPAPETLLPLGSAERGIEAAMQTFARAGIDTSRIQLVDGSGLSRMNLVAPSMITRLLGYMWLHPDARIREAFYESLPVAGVDGTLQYRISQGSLRGRVRAKTGTVSNASTLSGYVTTAGGTPLAFCLMCNHYTVKTREVREAQDALVAILARYLR